LYLPFRAAVLIHSGLPWLFNSKVLGSTGRLRHGRLFLSLTSDEVEQFCLDGGARPVFVSIEYFKYCIGRLQTKYCGDSSHSSRVDGHPESTLIIVFPWIGDLNILILAWLIVVTRRHGNGMSMHVQCLLEHLFGDLPRLNVVCWIIEPGVCFKVDDPACGLVVARTCSNGSIACEVWTLLDVLARAWWPLVVCRCLTL
jgi:hypothetical protein